MDMNKDTTSTQKKLRRTRDDRVVAGVCSGAARFFDVDANIIRIALAVFTVFGGAGIALYVIGWVLIPEEGAEKAIAEDMIKKASDSPAFQDAVQKTRDAFNKQRTHA
ncbi:PspC domain-containing protein [Actinomadura spongiicola]|uniref:PspC domain-containing protein n=1 Tax=Actinomadura spongiicola TaxID=2303421 RepID=A0A372GLD5_9ACTN|nr:PspC domain-containing protein [Actinomadura spongiicola]RFS85992.1 PspC domain-containing protein [Actinomadura spongiicola]